MLRKEDFMSGDDYFSNNLGFVIDGVPKGDITGAMGYLMGECCMTRKEALSYCSRIAQAYLSSRPKAVEGGVF